MDSKKEQESSGQVKAAIIGGIFILLAACVSGVFLIISTVLDNHELGISPTQSNSLISQPTSIFQPTASSITGDCQEASGQRLSSLPYTPSNGCIFIIEWWKPPNAFDCGILITADPPSISRNISGKWWNTSPAYVDSHVQGYLQTNPGCKVDDQR